MAGNLRTIKTNLLFRSFGLDKATIDEESRTVALSFSSEYPVKRTFHDEEGLEVLSHEPGACDLSRLNDGAPLLVNHREDDQVGVVEVAEIGPDKRGRAVVRFSKSQRGTEIWNDVKEGIRRGVSVGYRINKMIRERSANGQETVYRATSWTPLELTLAVVGADPTVGVNRSLPNEFSTEVQNEPETISQRKQTTMEPVTTPAPAVPAPAPAAAPAIVRSESEIVAADRARSKEIWAIANQFKRTGAEASDAVVNGMTVDGYRKLVLDSLQTPAANPETVTRSASDVLPAGKTPGDLFIESEQYRSMVDKYKRSGKMPQGMSLSADVPYVRATLTGSGLTSIAKEPGVVLLEQQPLVISAIIPSVPTDALTVRYTQESSYTNASTALAEEGEYQEATFALEEVDATVRKVGVLAKITDEQLADYNYTRDYVNNRVRFMVDSRVDNHLLNGTGSSNQIKGILSFSGIQTQAVGANTVPDAIHKAITKVRSTGFFEPDYIVLHPTDWEGIRLMKDNNGNYYGGGPFSTLAPTLWGLPVVQTTAIAAGTGLVGAFRMGCAARPKAGLSVETSNSNGDDFKYGRISVRADRRLTLCCYRPLAFCKVTGIA